MEGNFLTSSENENFQPTSLSTPPTTSFSCVGRTPGAYYADPEAGCQLFHRCVLFFIFLKFLIFLIFLYFSKYFDFNTFIDFQMCGGGWPVLPVSVPLPKRNRLLRGVNLGEKTIHLQLFIPRSSQPATGGGKQIAPLCQVCEHVIFFKQYIHLKYGEKFGFVCNFFCQHDQKGLQSAHMLFIEQKSFHFAFGGTPSPHSGPILAFRLSLHL